MRIMQVLCWLGHTRTWRSFNIRNEDVPKDLAKIFEHPWISLEYVTRDGHSSIDTNCRLTVHRRFCWCKSFRLEEAVCESQKRDHVNLDMLISNCKNASHCVQMLLPMEEDSLKLVSTVNVVSLLECYLYNFNINFVVWSTLHIFLIFVTFSSIPLLHCCLNLFLVSYHFFSVHLHALFCSIKFLKSIIQSNFLFFLSIRW